ncbi:hypothetical protein [Chondromyces crocatus]|uniref:Lipoprotein n=1 Tax=Chondromyces crocatus TaxID=52 RepID=A0A0K1EIX0_CHOCO|nr:hypothetical protein [Chondromyces crocatus]AKT40810.1 uncharacterized protein CMC5_049660 [Chondromyces crocatus]
MVCARALASLARAAWLAAFTATLGGCANSSEDLGTFETATAIVIDPNAFPRGLPCTDAPGAMQSYVATLIDHTDPSAPFALPSSDPLPCSQQTQFRYVVPGHVYAASVDGYEQASNVLVPRGGHGSGSRRMKLGTGVRRDDDRRWTTLPDVTPRWRIDCAEQAAQDGASLNMGGCQLVSDRGTSAVTAIQFDLQATLGSLRCATEDGSGEVSRFDVIPSDGAQAEIVDVPCPPEGPIRIEEGVSAGRVYTFRIEAHGPRATYAASCEAVTVENRTVSAVCSPLTANGVLNIPVDAVVEASGLTCGTTLGNYIVRLSSLALPPTIDAFESSALHCTESARFTTLPPGPYEGAVYEPGEAGGAPIAICQGEVSPGTTTFATCAAAP